MKKIKVEFITNTGIQFVIEFNKKYSKKKINQIIDDLFINRDIEIADFQIKENKKPKYEKIKTN
jgi:hypothetical protein